MNYDQAIHVLTHYLNINEDSIVVHKHPESDLRDIIMSGSGAYGNEIHNLIHAIEWAQGNDSFLIAPDYIEDIKFKPDEARLVLTIKG